MHNRNSVPKNPKTFAGGQSSSSSPQRSSSSPGLHLQPLSFQHWFIPFIIISSIFTLLMLRRWWGYIEEILYTCYCGSCVRGCKRLWKPNSYVWWSICCCCGRSCARYFHHNSYIHIDDYYMHEIPPLLPNNPVPKKSKGISSSAAVSELSLSSVSSSISSSSRSNSSSNNKNNNNNRKRTIQPEAIQQTHILIPKNKYGSNGSSSTSGISGIHLKNEGSGAMPYNNYKSASSTIPSSSDTKVSIQSSSESTVPPHRNNKHHSNNNSIPVPTASSTETESITITTLPPHWLVFDPEYGVQLHSNIENLRRTNNRNIPQKNYYMDDLPE